jgi:hypothetical protein
MFRALVWKEVRDCRLWALVMLLGSGWLAASMAFDFESHLLREIDVFSFRGDTPIDPSRDDVLTAAVALCAVLFGAVLGLWQTIPESSSGTAGFFVHLARRRTRVAAAKLAAGLALFGGAVALPLVAGAALMIQRQTWLVPLGWSDFHAVWLTLGCGALAWLGCLAAGLREAPWRRPAEALAGVIVVGAAVMSALALRDHAFGLAVMMVTATATLAGVWLFSGLAAREF